MHDYIFFEFNHASTKKDGCAKLVVLTELKCTVGQNSDGCSLQYRNEPGMTPNTNKS